MHDLRAASVASSTRRRDVSCAQESVTPAAQEFGPRVSIPASCCRNPIGVVRATRGNEVPVPRHALLPVLTNLPAVIEPPSDAARCVCQALMTLSTRMDAVLSGQPFLRAVVTPVRQRPRTQRLGAAPNVLRKSADDECASNLGPESWRSQSGPSGARPPIRVEGVSPK